jgi:hypothetical protein
MEETQETLVPLGHVIGKEIARLGRSGEVSAREELRLHVWPFLQDLVEAVTYALSAVTEEEPALPVELVARTVVILSALLKHGQATLSAPLFTVLSRMATEVTEALTELADSDELERALAAEIERLQGQIKLSAAGGSAEGGGEGAPNGSVSPETVP